MTNKFLLNKTIKISIRDHKILLAMMSNLKSFVDDAIQKGGDEEVKIMFHVEQVQDEIKKEEFNAEKWVL